MHENNQYKQDRTQFVLIQLDLRLRPCCDWTWKFGKLQASPDNYHTCDVSNSRIRIEITVLLNVLHSHRGLSQSSLTTDYAVYYPAFGPPRICESV